MELNDILKQFKRIQPDSAFTEKSKRTVLAHIPREPWSARRTIMSIFETAIAVGLAGFFILVVTGRFSGSKYIAPVQFSVINPKTLNAEAQAIDIQIQLANLTYQDASTTTGDVSTPQVAAAIISKQPALLMAAQASSSAASASSSTAVASSAPASSSSATASSTTSSTLSIDQALQELSK